jgi:hypothetical protein
VKATTVLLSVFCVGSSIAVTPCATDNARYHVTPRSSVTLQGGEPLDPDTHPKRSFDADTDPGADGGGAQQVIGHGSLSDIGLVPPVSDIGPLDLQDPIRVEIQVLWWLFDRVDRAGPAFRVGTALTPAASHTLERPRARRTSAGKSPASDRE